MTGTPLDARSHLESLLGQPLRARDGTTVTVLEVHRSVAVVRAGDKEVVLLVAWVQQALDRLLSTGEIAVPAGAYDIWTEPIETLLLAPDGRTRADGLIALAGPPEWNIRAGEAVDRPALHARFGGNGRTRIAPSASTPNIFVFVDAEDKESGFWEVGVLHLPGERDRGKGQSNANRALASLADSGRALRVFWRGADGIVYMGGFEADLRDPFYFREAEGRGGVREQRIVFRLVPADMVVELEPEVTRTAVEPDDRTADQPEAIVPPTSPGVAVTTAPSRPDIALRPLLARALRQLGARGPWPPVLLASCAAIVLTTWVWTSAPVRPAVTTWFLLVCPGMALVRLLPDRGLMLRLVLAVAASLVLETLVATFMLEAKAWSPSATLGILLLITVAATVLDLRARPRRPWVVARLDHALPGWTRR